MKLILSASLSLILFITASAQQKQSQITVTDLTQIKQLGSVTISHDGKNVIYTVNSISPNNQTAGEYTYKSQIHISALMPAGESRALTSASAGATQPAWSPDDQKIAFVRPVNNKPQIFVLNMEGGEPVQITDFKYGALQPKWSPDGKQILFSSVITLEELLKDSVINNKKEYPAWPLEKPGFAKNQNLINAAKANPNGTLQEIRAYLENNETKKIAKVFTNLNFQGESATDPQLRFTHYFLVDARPGATPQKLTRGFYSFANAEFFADGKRIILTSSIDSVQHADRSSQSEIYSLDLKSGKLHTILSKEKIRFSSPSISPTGRWLAYQYSPEDGINISKLALLDIKDPKAKPIEIPFDRNKGNLEWSDDERFLYFTAQSNGGVPLYRVDTRNFKVEQLSDFDSGISGFDLSKNKLVYVKTEVKNPFELYSADLANKNPSALTTFNSSWVGSKALSMPEKKSYTNSKGLKVEYWVMKPANFDSTKKYPMVLQIHGGPTAMWGPGEASMWHEFQYFSSMGYGVVYANPRGSGGYGQEYLRANYQNWGEGPTEDVLGALDGAVAEGWADTSKLTVTGGSYAGYLTAWIIAHDQRFAAASAQRGVYELGTFFGEGNAWRLVPNYFGGFPWQENISPILKRESPLSYVKDINTPFLIFHGENDLRTGVIQSEMLYKSLKVQGKTVEYVRHPGATHELVRSGNVRQRIDQMLRIYEFFERYVK